MTIPKAILMSAALLAAAIIIFSFYNRYEVIGGNSAAPAAWKIDKLTGDVWLCASGRCTFWSN